MTNSSHLEMILWKQTLPVEKAGITYGTTELRICANFFLSDLLYNQNVNCKIVD